MKPRSSYVTKYHFCTKDSKCSHIFVKTHDGYPAIVEVEPFDHAGGILISTLQTSVAPQNLMAECLNKTTEFKSEVCFLTHLGIDLQHIYGYSLFFKDPKSDVPKLQLGQRFALPLLYLKNIDLSPVEEGPCLLNVIEESEHLSVFYSLIKRSNCKDLFCTGGVYTVFGPDNAMLENAYGPQGRALKSKSDHLDGVICSYVAVGQYNDMNGEMQSISGEKMTISKGILSIRNYKTAEVQPMVKVRNGTLVVITSTGVMTQTKPFTYIRPKKLANRVSSYDVARDAKLLMDFQISFAQTVRAEMKLHLSEMLSKLEELDELEEDMERMESKVKLVGFYFEHAKRAAKTAALQTPSNELVKNVINL